MASCCEVAPQVVVTLSGDKGGGFGGSGREGNTADTVTCTPAVRFPRYISVASGLQQRSTDVHHVLLQGERPTGSGWHQCDSLVCPA